MDKKALLTLLIETPEEARELGHWLLEGCALDEEAFPSGPGPEGKAEPKQPLKRTAMDYFILLSKSIAAIWLLLGSTCLILLPLRRVAEEMAVSVGSLLAVMLALALILVHRGPDLAAWIWPKPPCYEEDDEEDFDI